MALIVPGHDCTCHGEEDHNYAPMFRGGSFPFGKQEEAPKASDVKEALELILELAEASVLDERATDDPELQSIREQRLQAVAVVRRFIDKSFDVEGRQ